MHLSTVAWITLVAPLVAAGLILLVTRTSKPLAAALAILSALITCAGAWWLWYLTPDPNPQQIVHNSIFAVFVLAANWIVRRK